jgi:tryptophan halogenase
MTPRFVKQVVVAGSGTDALLAAATLRRQLPGLAVTLLRDPAAAAPDPAGESTTPVVLQHLCNTLGLQGNDVHLRGRPVWTLGFKCLWGARGTFFRSFDASFTKAVPGLRTDPGFLAAQGGLELSSPGAALMSAGKLFPRDGANAFKPMENVTGLNFRTELLDAMLLRACQVLGVTVRHGRIAGFTRSPDTLQLEDGGALAADLFVDATGSEARLSTLAGNTGWIGYGDACLATRAATVVRRRGSEPIRPFTTLETRPAGWRWRVEHDDAIGLGHAWHHDFISDDEACAELVAKAGDPALSPRIHQWDCGRRREAWSGPVVAVGDASGRVEPLASLRIQQLIIHVHWLVRVLGETDGQPGERSRQAYNGIVADAWDENRDFHALHYRFNNAADTPFWRMARETAAPVAYAGVVDLYQSIGPSSLLTNSLPTWPGLLGIDAWMAAMLGLGVPFRHHPEIPAAEKKAWDSQCEQRRQLARQAVPAELCIGAARRAARPEPRVPLP